MQNLITALIVMPFLFAGIIALVRNSKVRAGIVYVCGALIAVTSVVTAVTWFMGGEIVTFDLAYTSIFDKVILAGDFFLMFVVVYLSCKHHKYLIALLSIVQTAIVAYVELAGFHVPHSDHIRIDWLTFIMILIIGVIGVAVGIYAVGYMHGYHQHHTEFKDRRSFFFAMIFIFYGAMFGLVTAQNLIWLYFFWELTSVLSFLLIGYTKTDIAITNSFRALWMNLLGGLAMAIAIIYCVQVENTLNLNNIIANGASSGLLIPIAMLAVAALIKSAQFPFSGWLLGAMVAPTPSSALLHSATMVKAGVYLLIRLSVAMTGNDVGKMVYMIGGFTFFAASCLAISHSDGKKVLAYSTISNLGLIVACTGVAHEETVWAACFLVLFHAVSKSVLFQCVGAIENATGSRSIEDMQGLWGRFPKLAMILMVGIAAMYLAPFGMLISKWAALKAFVDAGSSAMVLFIVFGSATTMFYWTKWLAKILGLNHKRKLDKTKWNEYISMFLHVALIILLCIGVPVISDYVMEPQITSMFNGYHAFFTKENMWIMVVLVCAVFIVPVINYFLSKKANYVPVLAYMGGVNSGDNKHFINSAGEDEELVVSSWYLMDYVSDVKLFMFSALVGTLILVIQLCIVVGGAF